MYTGLTGALKLVHPLKSTEQNIAYISGWSIEDKTEMVETAKIDSIHKDAFPSFQSWSASADGTIVFEKKNRQKDLFGIKHRGDKIELVFYLNDTSETDKDVCFRGSGYIESLSVDLAAEDKGNVSISVKGAGSLDIMVNGKNAKTEQPVWIPSFGMKVTDGDLYIAAIEGQNPFKLESGDLKVKL